MSIFNSIKDYAQLKAEGCKDAVQIINNNKGQLKNPAIQECINMALFNTTKYAEVIKEIDGERLKNIGKVATTATATCCIAVITAIVS